MHVLIRGFALVGAVIVCGGCSSSHPDQGTSQPPSCRMLDMSVCPSPMPSYANDIAPLFDRDCNLSMCHGPDGDQWPLTDRASIVAWEGLVVYDAENCRMPPPDAGIPALTIAERKMVIGWLACGSPNN